jgi:microcystin-dependent protein
MSTEPFIGEIKMFAFDFAPKNHFLCAGQLLAISTNSALFSLLGTVYGGDGIQTFGLPDLRGRTPISQGNGGGLSPQVIGQKAGSENVTLLAPNLPSHIHTLTNAKGSIAVNSANGDTGSPSGAFLSASTANIYAEGPESGKTLGGANISGTTDPAGGNQPISIINPYLVVNYSIAVNGIYPSRS